MEIVKEEYTGKLVPPGTPEAMAEAISIYYKDSCLLDSHGKAARKQIESRFSMGAMTNSYLEVYDKVLRSKVVS